MAFAVSATHAYLDTGDYTITTYITDVGGSKVTLNSTINVGNPDMVGGHDRTSHHEPWL